MGTNGFRDLRVYQMAEDLSDAVWRIASKWEELARRTVGQQLIRSADSIGANIAEGSGRGTFRDNRYFVLVARGSLYETQHWLRRACARNFLAPEEILLLTTILDALAPQLNAYLASLTRRANNPKRPK